MYLPCLKGKERNSKSSRGLKSKTTSGLKLLSPQQAAVHCSGLRWEHQDKRRRRNAHEDRAHITPTSESPPVHINASRSDYGSCSVAHWNDEIAAMERKYEAEKAQQEKRNKKRDVADVGSAIYKAIEKTKPSDVPKPEAEKSGFVSAAEFKLRNHVPDLHARAPCSRPIIWLSVRCFSS